MAIATLIAVASIITIFFMEFRPEGNLLDVDGMITASVVSKAGRDRNSVRATARCSRTQKPCRP
jgi:hypothetical protein